MRPTRRRAGPVVLHEVLEGGVVDRVGDLHTAISTPLPACVNRLANAGTSSACTPARVPGTGRASSRKRQKGLAKRICSGVRQSGVRRAGLATIAATQTGARGGDVETVQAVGGRGGHRSRFPRSAPHAPGTCRPCPRACAGRQHRPQDRDVRFSRGRRAATAMGLRCENGVSGGMIVSTVRPSCRQLIRARPRVDADSRNMIITDVGIAVVMPKGCAPKGRWSAPPNGQRRPS